MRPTRALTAILVALACACSPGGSPSAQESQPSGQPQADAPPEGMAVAIFAGGCFWCMEGPFEAIEGVTEVLSGYTGGPEQNPTYHDVARGRTGHTEAVRVVFDPDTVSYAQLLQAYWRAMDPTDAGGQFADRGTQYRPAIFYFDEAQRVAAEASKAEMQAEGPFAAPIIVPIQPAEPFWVAEDYHQDYYRTNADHYQRYRRGSGRSAFIERHWGSGH